MRLRKAPTTPLLTKLGPLESKVLRAVWKCGNATVNELCEHGGLDVAYTTILTTLDRLYNKQFLDRVTEGRAFRYSSRFTEEELQRATALDAVRKLLASVPSARLPLSYLVEALSEHDAQLLDELQQIIEQKRRSGV